MNLPSRYRFELASPADEPQLRAVLAATPMPGAIQVAFRREPSYFAAACVEGTFYQSVVCRWVEGERIVGFGSRSVTSRWVNGRVEPIGYLSQLRLLAEHRRRGLVARGYAFFRQLHLDGRTPLYLTTIADDNRAALDLLTSGRAGLPAYHDVGRYHTFVFAGGRMSRNDVAPDIDVRRATLDDRSAIVKFLAEEGPRRQFFPVVDAGDLFAHGGLYHGLAPGDLWLARRDGELCGTFGVWDQRSFRQQEIVGYTSPLRWLRPAYNAVAPWLRRPTLPPPETTLACRFAALPVTRGHDPAPLFTLLHRALSERVPAGETLLFGVHDDDPWAGELQRRSGFCYTTRLFLVCFEDGEAMRRGLDRRPPYLELGGL